MSRNIFLVVMASLFSLVAVPCVATTPEPGGGSPPHGSEGSTMGQFDRGEQSVHLVLSTWATEEPSEKTVPREAHAEESQAKSDDQWQFMLAPYLWMSSLSSTVDVGPVSASADVCFSELLKQMDIGGQMRFEGLRGRWGFYLDGTYLGLSGDMKARIGPFQIRGVDIDTDFTQAWLDFGGMYRFGEHGRSFDVMLGGRYAYAGVDVTGNALLDFDGSVDFVSPVIGGRIEYALTEVWAISLSGDLGGFGIDDAADLAWGLTGILGYRISKCATLGIGYRYYDISFGNAKMDLDLQMHGPLVGIAFQF